LPGHHNFITMLKPCDLKVGTPDKKVKSIPIARGLMHVRDDKLIVFLDV
jgi:F0F1-type ATP synthase epsilon subunit